MNDRTGATTTIATGEVQPHGLAADESGAYGLTRDEVLRGAKR
jgi:hypothetical protein